MMATNQETNGQLSSYRSRWWRPGRGALVRLDKQLDYRPGVSSESDDEGSKIVDGFLPDAHKGKP